MIWRMSIGHGSGAGASSRRVFLRLPTQRLDRPVVVAGRDHDIGLRPAIMRSAVAVSTGRLNATMPPNADRSSHS